MTLIAKVPESLLKYSPYTVTRLLERENEYYAYLGFHDAKYYIQINDTLTEEIKFYWKTNKLKSNPRIMELFFILHKSEGSIVRPSLVKFVESNKIPALLKT